MAKWPNHFISGKQFQKRPNDNPGVQPNPRVATNVSTELSLSPHLQQKISIKFKFCYEK